ncbi:MAG: sulfatase [Magnetococcales bacterium]|nr:sulfatase [Magnetococcales bacterium]
MKIDNRLTPLLLLLALPLLLMPGGNSFAETESAPPVLWEVNPLTVTSNTPVKDTDATLVADKFGRLDSSAGNPDQGGGNPRPGAELPPELIPPDPQNLPNIFMILVDTLRYDHTNMGGYVRNTTPNMEEFSETAYVFKNAKSQASWTIPATASILYGLYPQNHGINAKPDTRPLEDPATGTLITQFQNLGGYHAISIQRNSNIEYLIGDFDEHYSHGRWYLHSDGSAVIEAMNRAQGISPRDKTFMFLGLFSPHWPYNFSIDDTDYFEEFLIDETYRNTGEKLIEATSFASPAGELTYMDIPENIREGFSLPPDGEDAYRDARIYVAAYDAEVKYADEQIGVFLDRLKELDLYDDAIVIIMADHGEIMSEQEQPFHHGNHLFDSELAVPLMIKFPNQNRQETVLSSVRSVDVLPTLLDYLNINTTKEIDGKTLYPLLKGDTIDFAERPLFSYIETVGTKMSLYSSEMHLIEHAHSGEGLLFNVDNDPSEQTDLAGVKPIQLETLQESIYEIHCPAVSDKCGE